MQLHQAITTRPLAALLLAAAACVAGPARAAADAPDYSLAERLIFMSPQLTAVRPPQTLRYALKRSGALEAGFDDSVGVVLTAQADGRCCNGRAEFLNGPRRLSLPEVEGAEANPVVMYFLEHDVREMQRLTRGSQNHFRKRIRMAIYGAATVTDVKLPYRGGEVDGKLVSFWPYLDDPNRVRYEKFARKEYRFLLAQAVPGGVYAIRTQIDGPAAGAAPLLVEEMLAEGAQPGALNTHP